MGKFKQISKTNKLTEERLARLKAASKDSEAKEQPVQDVKKKANKEEKSTSTSTEFAKDTATSGDDKIIPFICEPCRVRQRRQDAFGFCESCLEFLCVGCIEDHKYGKVHRTHSHSILEGNAFRRETESDNLTQEVCKCMSGFVRFFCKDHKSLICKTCKMYTHKKCHIAGLADISEDFVDSKPFKTEMKELHSIRNKCDRFRKLCQNDIDVISAKFSEILNEINQIRRKITLAIDKFEDEIKRELNRVFAKEEKRINDKKVKCELLKSSADKKIKTVEKLRDENNDVEVFVSFHKFHGETRKLQESFNSIQKDKDDIAISFTKSNIIDMFLQLEKLGEVSCEKISRPVPEKEVKPLWSNRVRMQWSPELMSDSTPTDRVKSQTHTKPLKTKHKDGLKSAPLAEVRNVPKRLIKSGPPKHKDGDQAKQTDTQQKNQFTSKRTHLHAKRKAVMENYRTRGGVFY